MIRAGVALAVAAAIVAGAAPAVAALPGRNGVLLVSASTSEGDSCAPLGPPEIVGRIADWDCDEPPPYGMFLAGPGRILVPWLADPFSAGTFAAGGAWALLEGPSEILYAAALRPGARPVSLHRRGHSPAVSADGQWIAYARGHPGRSPGPPGGIYVARMAGGPPRFIADGQNPRWSTRGRLAFNTDGGTMITDERARHPRRVGHGWFEDWAPNGRELLVTHTRSSPGGGYRYALYAERIDARRPRSRQLTKWNFWPIESAVWSPDGRYVAFLKIVDLGGRSGLFTIPARSRTPQAWHQWRKLLTNAAEVNDWQPLP